MRGRSLSVSVVMAVRNGAGHLAAALASIDRAGRTAEEIIVVDGDSTDATAEVAARHPRVRVVAQRGKGIAGAYNQGVAASRGETIAFLSHDDLWAEGKLAIQLAALEADPALMLSFGHVRHVLAGEPPPGFRRDLLDRATPGYIMETMVARREAFARVGPFDPAFSTAEDVDWIARARDLGLPIALTPEIVLTKRIHGGNSSLVDPNGGASLFMALRRAAARRREK